MKKDSKVRIGGTGRYKNQVGTVIKEIKYAASNEIYYKVKMDKDRCEIIFLKEELIEIHDPKNKEKHQK